MVDAKILHFKCTIMLFRELFLFEIVYSQEGGDSERWGFQILSSLLDV